MKLYAPKYYKQFRCIADKCTHSCCIGWEIDVDGETLEKYQSLTGNYAEVIRNSISTDGTPHFKLGKCDRCPHLDERGLCKIILNVGEDYLCDICREHPRFYNFTRVAEVGLGMSCPEAARVILDFSDYATTEYIGNVDAESDEIGFDGLAQRQKIYEILQNSKLDYTSRLENIRRDYSIESVSDDLWLDALDSLEYLDINHKKLFISFSSDRIECGKTEYFERFLAYLIYRHCTEAVDMEDFCARLEFCLFCERLLASLASTESASSLQEVARLASIISEEIEYSDDNTFNLTYR